jgi:hypothetical protein
LAVPREDVSNIADRGVHLRDILALIVTGHAAGHRAAGFDHVLQVSPQEPAEADKSPALTLFSRSRTPWTSWSAIARSRRHS